MFGRKSVAMCSRMPNWKYPGAWMSSLREEEEEVLVNAILIVEFDPNPEKFE